MSSTKANSAYEERKKAGGEQRITVRIDAKTASDLADLVQREGSIKAAIIDAIQWKAALHAYHDPKNSGP